MFDFNHEARALCVERVVRWRGGGGGGGGVIRTILFLRNFVESLSVFGAPRYCSIRRCHSRVNYALYTR